MYRQPAYVMNDVGALHRIIGQYPFATIACVKDGGILFAYAPVVQYSTEGPFGSLHFHLARANDMATLAQSGARLSFSFNGPDAFISPDWYVSQGRVPTWDYIRVEGEGVATVLTEEASRGHLVALSAQEEEKLLPKKPWTIAKMDQQRFETMSKSIIGFSVKLERLEGTFKLSQNSSPEDVAGVLVGLRERGDAASLKIAEAVEKLPPR